jgi:DivIVA domain-containing protein
MRLSALEIRKQDFARSLRGYDEEDVDAFLHVVAQQWQEVTDEHRRMAERVSELETKLDHYVKVEEAMQEALKSAREGARIRIETAEKEAEALLEDAERRSSQVVEEAEQLKARNLQDLQTARDRMWNDVHALRTERAQMIARLRAFLNSEMEVLSHYEADTQNSVVQEKPAEVSETAADEEEASSSDGTGSDSDAELQSGSIHDLALPSEADIAGEPVEQDEDSGDDIKNIRKALEDLDP